MKFIKEVFNHFFDSNTFQQGAALAYYFVFSLIPMIIIITSLLGLFFGDYAVSGEVYAQLKDILGGDGAKQIESIIKNHHTIHSSGLTTIVGLFTLIFSASGMFSQIHNSFNSIWNIKEKPMSSIVKYILKHIVSFFIMIGSFFIILISTIISSFIIKHSNNFHGDYNFIYVYEHFLSLAVMSVVFALMFKFLGDTVIAFKAIVIGSIITSLLFIFGKFCISLYIGHSNISSTFGSASILALLMLWVYYTTQIIFLGASFVYVISKRLGYEIQPTNNAVKIKNVEINNKP